MTNIDEQAAVRKRPRGRMEEMAAERLTGAIEKLEPIPDGAALFYSIQEARDDMRNFARAIALIAVQAMAVDDSVEAVERMVGGW